ncbi:hypothetical protein LASUN_06240 [Lentilactobacillus sunkii]|uniref:D-alanyl-D-alanine carboxypeptidase n=1 Tax=Lentilactobacillus sunkii TaxID=481719 RepID=A0A1E7XGG7_9LACO|nr:hypothetical protein [Lentilactobacillus sunkii]OFA12072.1 hypothetical protein LASUN_06240 [Lentilactobacillus sunkii]
MKKQLILLTGLMTALTGLSLATSPQSVKAAGVYHAIKSKTANNTAFHWKGNKKAYLWNYNLTQKKHHLTNYPKTTWYASRVLKMTNGTKTGIFYYVANQSGNSYGYVWKGYLAKGAISDNGAQSNSSNTANGSNKNWITKDNPWGVPHPTKVELNDLKNSTSGDEYNSTITYYQDLPIINSFNGATYNSKLDDAAADYLGNNSSPLTKHEWGDKLKDIQYIKFSTQPTAQQIKNITGGALTFKQFVLNDLTKQRINLSDYEGWQIGMFSLPIYQKGSSPSNDNTHTGQYVIALYNPNK